MVSLKRYDSLSRNLVKFGLTPNETQCYLALLRNGSMAAVEIGNELNVLTNAVYRLTKKLIKAGLAVELSTTPATYQAVGLEVAITALASKRTREIEEAKIQAIEYGREMEIAKGSQTSVEVLTGKQGLMEKYLELATKARQEILIISIGEPVSDEVKIVNRDAIERGVRIRFIVHRFDSNNESMVNSYIRMGIELKHNPDSGYHLVVVDRKVALLAISDPKNTEERTIMMIYNAGLAKAMANFFYSIWGKLPNLQI